MQRRSAAIVLVSVCAVVCAAGCAVTVRDRPRTVVVKTPPGQQQQPVYRVRAWTYRYYPEARVYYSCDRDMWFYMENDRWVANVRLPNRFRADLEDCVTVDLDTESPYEQDRAVVIAHPGRGHDRMDERFADRDDRDGPGNRGIGKAKGHSKHASADKDGDRDE